MSQYENRIGVLAPNILLPKASADYYKWAVVACDQYTSEPEYWAAADELAGDAPSALRLIFPEAYLGKPGEDERINGIKAAMRKYLAEGVLEEHEQGFVLVKRSVGGNERLGLVLALDLEQYDYNKGATTLIRATEGTIVERIPPRLRVREGAPIELPHILVLIDDEGRTVIEPLLDKVGETKPLYDTELMLGGGHIEGWLINKPEMINKIIAALTQLSDAKRFKEKYGENHEPLLFAMGDGNHSFATAKAAWDNIKAAIPREQWEGHPTRYALVEIENVHDDGIIFEPIHRVLFNVGGEACIQNLIDLLKQKNGDVEHKRYQSYEVLLADVDCDFGGAHALPYFTGNTAGMLIVKTPAQQLSVGTLQNAIDELLKNEAGAEVDYIHGQDVVLKLSRENGAAGFLLPGMKKSELFRTIVYDGALPRKTFSMGEANEKRYYMECRRILP